MIRKILVIGLILMGAGGPCPCCIAEVSTSFLDEAKSPPKTQRSKCGCCRPKTADNDHELPQREQPACPCQFRDLQPMTLLDSLLKVSDQFHLLLLQEMAVHLSAFHVPFVMSHESMAAHAPYESTAFPHWTCQDILCALQISRC